MLTPEEIKEINKKIENFTQDKWNLSDGYIWQNYGAYNESWDRLMEVIEKIESIGDDLDTEKNYHFYIGKRYTRVIYDWNGFHQYPDKEDFERFEKSSKDYRHIVFDNDKRLSTFVAVSDFIDWYNEKYK